MDRRGFLGTMLALGAAPAIVRAESLMRIVYRPEMLLGSVETGLIGFRHTLYGDGIHDDTLALQAFVNGAAVIDHRTGLPTASRLFNGTYLISGTINMDKDAKTGLQNFRVIGAKSMEGNAMFEWKQPVANPFNRLDNCFMAMQSAVAS